MVAHALGIPSHAVTVEIRRMGGGFGGKETQSNQFAAIAAIAAKRLGRAVKIRPDRDDDMTATGKRHDFLIDYEVGFDDEGSIPGVDYIYAARCGFSSDLSGPVTDRALFHCDNAYFYPAVHARSAPLYTNTVSNTAFRGFGGPQGMVGAERVIDEVAFALGKDAARNPQAQFLRRRRPQRDALSPDGRGQHHRAHRRRARDELRLCAPPPHDPRLQRQQPLHQARPGADAGEVRHLVHRHPLQPGRRAGACLHRRLGASEPWRHRDGAGALRQGRAGRRRRVPDRHRPGEDHRDDDRQGAQHLGDRGLVGLRPQRHGGAERGPHHPRPAGRFRGREIPGAARPDRVQAEPGARRQPGNPVRRSGQAGLYGARPAFGSRLLQDAEDPLEPRQGRGPPVLLFRLWRVLLGGLDRHADRRICGRAHRHPARDRPLAEPGDRSRPGRRRLHPGHGLADHGGIVVGREGAAAGPMRRRPTRSRWPPTGQKSST